MASITQRLPLSGERDGELKTKDKVVETPRPKLTDLTDRRILTFWLFTISSTASFVLWVVAATFVSHIPLRNYHSSSPPPPQQQKQLTGTTVAFNSSFTAHDFLPLESLALASLATETARHISIDVWFAVALTTALDAIAVVLTFNGLLIRRFHFAVSQRLMFIASALSYGVLQRHGFVARHPLVAVGMGFGLYLLFDRALDRFERPMPAGGLRAASKWGSIDKYSADLGFVEASWPRASFLAACVGGFGLSLTMLVPPPWSALVPILHIFFESVFLSAMGAKRTARYLVLCSPVFFATICVHWGVSALVTVPRLVIRPWAFVGLVLLGRGLLDLLLKTSLRHRSEIKPTMVLAIYGLNGAGFLAVASYNVAFNLSGKDG